MSRNVSEITMPAGENGAKGMRCCEIYWENGLIFVPKWQCEEEGPEIAQKIGQSFPLF